MTRWLIFTGPAVALGLFFLLLGEGWTQAAAITAALTLLCAAWWVFEPVPIPFTSLLPVALAVLEQTEKKMQIPLLLGIAYAASIGGLARAGFVLNLVGAIVITAVCLLILD